MEGSWTGDDLAMKEHMTTRREERQRIMDRDAERGFYFIVITCLTIFSAVAVLMYLEIKGVNIF